MPQEKINSQTNYITTSRLAKLCGVSRFTIINWVKQEKITSIKTAGGHRRIPISEVITCLENFQKDERNSPAYIFKHCWDSAGSEGRNGKCRNCLINKRNITQCFVLVREVG